MLHSLKITQKYFEDVANHKKAFEIRKNDRGYSVGDFLALHEIKDNKYTGRFILVRVEYVLYDKDYCKDGFVTMSISPCQILNNNMKDCSYRGYSTIPIYGEKGES